MKTRPGVIDSPDGLSAGWGCRVQYREQKFDADRRIGRSELERPAGSDSDKELENITHSHMCLRIAGCRYGCLQPVRLRACVLSCLRGGLLSPPSRNGTSPVSEMCSLMPPERALEPSVPSIVRPGFVRRERLLPFAPLLPFKALATPARRRPLGPTTAARTSTQAS